MALIPENRMEQILNGDNITPANRDEYFVKQAIDNAGSGGADLPEPGTAGNVLTSNGTIWVSAAPSDNDYPVTAVLTAEMAIDQVSKDTVAIKAAFDAGKKVHLVIDGSVMGAFIDLPLTEIASDDSAWFCGIMSLGNTSQGYMLVHISENDDPDFSLFGVPTPSASHNGEILGVKNGSYDFVDAKTPLILTGTEGVDNAFTITGATLSEIYAAATAGRFVAVDIPLTNLGVTVRATLTGYDFDNDEYVFSFNSVLNGGSNGVYLFALECENALTGTYVLRNWSAT